MQSPRLVLLLVLLVAGGILTATVVPGVFILDEDNYLTSLVALRHGRFGLPGLEGLPHAKALFYFDPAINTRALPPPPVSSTAPPLYAFLALPFSLLGWRGLVALNTLAFLGTVWLLHDLGRRHGSERAGWLAATAFGLGSFALEYAQGVWPHMLSVFLVTAGVWLAARQREADGPWLAAAAGLCVGLACGVRYQNVVLLGGIGLGLLLLSRHGLLSARRLGATAAYGLGAAAPLLLSGYVNSIRQGSWNPISKGSGYLPGQGAVERSLGGDLLPFLWTKLVDYSAHPPLVGRALERHGYYMSQDGVTGAVEMLGGAVKKAWIQSSPWVALALALLALVWLGRRRLGGLLTRADTERELRALSLAVAPVLLAFALAGFRRFDGLCYNQRYFHELVPLAALAFAWALDGLPLRRDRVLAGALLAAIGVVGVDLFADATTFELRWLMHAPLLLAGVLLASFAWARTGRPRAPLALAVGACLGWGLAVHASDDLPASRDFRARNAAHREALAALLPAGPTGLLTYWGAKDAFGPLQLETDLVIADAWAADATPPGAIVDGMLAAGRRVFVMASALPEDLRRDVLRGRGALRHRVPVPGFGELEVFEVLPAVGAAEGTD